MNQVSTVRQRLAEIDRSAIELSEWQRHIAAAYRQHERLQIEREKDLHRAVQRYARIISELPAQPTLH